MNNTKDQPPIAETSMLKGIWNQISSVETLVAMGNAAGKPSTLEENQRLEKHWDTVDTARVELLADIQKYQKLREGFEGGVTINRTLGKKILFQEFNGINVANLRKIGGYNVFFVMLITGDPQFYLGSYNKNNKLVAFTCSKQALPLLSDWKKRSGVTLPSVRIGGGVIDITVEEKVEYLYEGREEYKADSIESFLAKWVERGRQANAAQKSTVQMFKDYSK